MNLDDLDYFKSIDSQNYLAQIDALPEQVAAAWALAQTLTLPEAYHSVRHVVMAGLGDAAIGGEVARALALPEAAVPVIVWREAELPPFVGADTLFVALSHTGNTAETTGLAEAALARGAKVLAVTTGGRLAALLEGRGAPVWRYEHTGDARGAIGFLALLPLAGLINLGLVSDKSAQVAEAVTALADQQRRLRADSPVHRNPAKRMAGQIMDRHALLFAGEHLAPAARRWQGQINQLAKAACHIVALSDADHNVAGTVFPEALISKYMALWLRAPSYSPQTARRAEVVREIYLTSGFNTDVIDAAGASPLAHAFTAMQFGDYTAYYLAMGYGVDPRPTPQIDYLKERLE